MNNLRQINTFSGGLNMDSDYSLLKENQYINAENVRVVVNEGSSTGSIQNIEGFVKVRPVIALGNEKVIHALTVRDFAIVFTKVNGGNFNVYRYDFSISEEEPLVTKFIANIDLGIKTSKGGVYAISSVSRWESDNNVKVYFADGQSQIKILNVDAAHDKFNATITIDSINILPKSSLPPFEFGGYGSGSLKAGKVQYCYQLFNTRSSETSISLLSPLITLNRSNNSDNSQDVIGSKKGDNTGLSVKLSTDLLSDNFNRAKVISIFYEDSVAVPTITIIDDISITGSYIYYEDKGSSFVSELTIDELNALISYPFIPEVIESKDNILFAANITEETWDLLPSEYDTRAYRCSTGDSFLLESNSGGIPIQFTVNELNTREIPFDHDCISDINYYKKSVYRYKKTSTGSYALGGMGKNIDYEFIIADLIEDSSTPQEEGKLNEDFSLVSMSQNTNSVQLYTLDSAGVRTNSGVIPLRGTDNHILNYSNSEIDIKLRGYQRDEIYRFAIVFYNENNIPSSAHWIADIRMPDCNDNGFGIFDSNQSVLTSNGSTNSNSLTTHPLGIRFTVKNLPSKVRGYEIVRCERTIADRTILSQGVVSTLTNYGKSSNMLVPLPYMTYSNKHGYVSKHPKDWNYEFLMSKYTSQEYFMFVSPEVCVNRNNATELLNKAGAVESIAYLRSTIKSAIGDRGDLKVMANAKSIKADGTKISLNTYNLNKNNGFINSNNSIQIDSGEFYSALLAKYYLRYSYIKPTAKIDSIKIANNTEPFDIKDDSWKTKPTTVGDKTYYNWMYDHEETDVDDNANNNRKIGPHGICCIFRSSNMIRNIGILDALNTPANANAVVLVNLRQEVTPYGGNSYSNRQNSVYIGIGSYNHNNNSATYTSNCFGGDTYIGVLDYTNGSFAYMPDDYNAAGSNRLFSGAYIPCESSVNLSLRSDDFSISKTYNSSDGYANHFVENDIIQIGDIYTQSEPLYIYNSAYSAQPRAKKFVSKSIYDIDNAVMDTRVLASQVKTNNEVTDSWTKFKVANYIDTDTRFGPINNMKLFRNNLLFWQSDAFGSLSVNERSLITDNNPGALTLGTGGILTRFDYLTTKNGIKENQLRAVTQSDSTVYWYDKDRNEICGFDGKLETVSKIKGVQSYLTKQKDNFSIDPSTCYDKKYNEVLFTLENKTLVFSEQIGAFTSFYTIKPDYYIEFSDKLYTFKDLNIYKYNFMDIAPLYNDKDKVSYIAFVVNKDYPQTKTFDNVEYDGNFTNSSNFDNVYFQSKRQTSYTLTKDNIDYREDTYKFAIPRNSIEMNEAELLANKSYKDRMKGKYMVCNYKYDCNNKNTFKVPYISTAYRYSMI